MPNLEETLRDRLDDPRSIVAGLSVNAGRLLLSFGSVGAHRRIVLHVNGDTVEEIFKPEPATDAEGNSADGDEAETIDPAKFSRPDLLALAEKAGITAPEKATKADIAALLNAAKQEA